MVSGTEPDLWFLRGFDSKVLLLTKRYTENLELEAVSPSAGECTLGANRRDHEKGDTAWRSSTATAGRSFTRRNIVEGIFAERRPRTAGAAGVARRGLQESTAFLIIDAQAEGGIRALELRLRLRVRGLQRGFLKGWVQATVDDLLASP